MAISRNPLMSGVSGSINKQIVYRQLHGKTVISAYPDMSDRKLSSKQKHVNQLMKKANAEAKKIIADEKLRDAALLRLNVTRNKLYTSLIREYFKIALKK